MKQLLLLLCSIENSICIIVIFVKSTVVVEATIVVIVAKTAVVAKANVVLGGGRGVENVAVVVAATVVGGDIESAAEAGCRT